MSEILGGFVRLLNDYLFIFLSLKKLGVGGGPKFAIRDAVISSRCVFPSLSPPEGAFHVIKYSWGDPRSQALVFLLFPF